MATPNQTESASKRHGHAIRALARTKNGKAVLDYLVEAGGFYQEICSDDPRKQDRRAAERDFVVRHIVKPLSKGAN